MSKRMLIDASHPEETRVVVLDGQKVEEFDFEAATKRPLKGNIYLAKVTRVEPSLQAAFVEYGGNRQGFLAFSEIHPDYYQIPVADRQALLAEQEAEARRQAEREDAEDDAAAEAAAGRRAAPALETMDGVEGPAPGSDEAIADEALDAAGDVVESGSAPSDEVAESDRAEGGEDDDYFPPADRPAEPDEAIPAVAAYADHDEHDHLALPDPAEEIREGIVDEQTAARSEFVAPATGDEPDSESQSVHEGLGEDTDGEAAGPVDPAEEIAQGIVDEQAAANAPMAVQGDAEGGEADGDQDARPLRAARPSQRWVRRRHYKIQEVIKRKQIILVQVVKEERGNKGAALTTYLSLAGRYCVLMPNTPRGGGISRKITSASDRKRLKDAVQGLELPEGMGLIIRTAGENRTKVEIKRDYEYLLRMWDTIRETTLKSNAPSCVYEEGDLIKRAIRDLYNKDVVEVVVEGDDAYRNAKDFMRMLMPSHAKNVKPYKEPVPLFQRMHIEAQLDAMFSPTVNLKSGGYIVINQTEALVSIDVNSGRATREHSIEETAHKTNLEAADEVARQLRLRDLAGLIVIDFIDMEESRNDRAVEKRIYNAVKNDRARIQIGKISQFGLLEMSRQRLRAGVIAGSTVPCPHCAGQGIVRSVESTALRVLRAVEDEAQKLKATAVNVKVPTDVAVYTLNQKRRELARIEYDYGMTVTFEPDNRILAGNFELDRITARSPDDKPRIATMEPTVIEPEIEEEDLEIVEEEEVATVEADEEETTEAAQDQPRQQDQQDQPANGEGTRRRRRRGGRNRSHSDGNRSSGQGGRGGQGGQSRAGQSHSDQSHSDQSHSDQARADQSHGGEPHNGQPHNDQAHQPHNGAARDESGEVSDQGEFEGEPVQQGRGPQQGSQGENPDGSPRRRRRRRGRRGRGTTGPIPYQGDGVPVDASVRDDNDDAVADETIRVEPNVESSPVWSLTPETAAQAAVQTPRETVTARVEAPAEEKAVVAAEPGPVRKGWWQRAFNRSE